METVRSPGMIVMRKKRKMPMEIITADEAHYQLLLQKKERRKRNGKE